MNRNNHIAGILRIFSSNGHNGLEGQLAIAILLEFHESIIYAQHKLIYVTDILN